MKRQGPQQKAFEILLDVLRELDRSNKPAYHSYRTVNSRLIEKKVHFATLGFAQFKEFIQAAEARGLVESNVEGLKHSVKRVES